MSIRVEAIRKGKTNFVHEKAKTSVFICTQRCFFYQNEKDNIFRQLQRDKSFKAKINELLSGRYDPILDDGTSKNITPVEKENNPLREFKAGRLKNTLT